MSKENDFKKLIENDPEVCTAVAVRKNGNLIQIMAPYGLEDTFNFKLRQHLTLNKMNDILPFILNV